MKLQSSRTSGKVNRNLYICRMFKFSFRRRSLLLTDATQGSLNFKLSLVKDRTRQSGHTIKKTISRETGT